MICLSQKQVKTRKPHNCWGCGKEFQVGTYMEVTNCVEDGKITSAYWCQECIAFYNKYRDDIDPYNDGIGYGDIEEFKREKGAIP